MSVLHVVLHKAIAQHHIKFPFISFAHRSIANRLLLCTRTHGSLHIFIYSFGPPATLAQSYAVNSTAYTVLIHRDRFFRSSSLCRMCACLRLDLPRLFFVNQLYIIGQCNLHNMFSFINNKPSPERKLTLESSENWRENERERKRYERKS